MEVAAIDKRTLYLSKVCGNLPPLGSEAREMLRTGISLQQAIAKIAQLKKE